MNEGGREFYWREQKRNGNKESRRNKDSLEADERDQATRRHGRGDWKAGEDGEPRAASEDLDVQEVGGLERGIEWLVQEMRIPGGGRPRSHRGLWLGQVESLRGTWGEEGSVSQ